MSAYGDVKAPISDRVLAPMNWPTKNAGVYVTTYHMQLSTARQLSGLVEYLNAVFAKVVEEGRTYPQEGEMGSEAFEKYFFAGDVFIGIINPSESGGSRIDVARGKRSWEECVAGFYYVSAVLYRVTSSISMQVKPNYPGRSSHICNAGFVVPGVHRGAGYGSRLAESYLHYAPRLGYQASVFNLVYVNNAASVRLWERLGFVKAGRIPRAGRLKTQDGSGEEYVDAWVIYKEF
ncbi:hypothetical protein APHAL10511_004788 [Amanita phalloides]|nr:hypothetical protein APHAL10511_004788 [Amanita phalloides]